MLLRLCAALSPLALVAACALMRPAPTSAPATYHGIVPCPDCAGVATSLTLGADGTYLVERRALGKPTAATLERGTYVARPDSQALLRPTDLSAPTRIGLDSAGARLLGRDGSPLAIGPLDPYVLAEGEPTRLRPGEAEYFVDAVRVVCADVGSRTCLRAIRAEGAAVGEWQLVYGGIDGFDFHPGNLYHLVVRERERDAEGLPADASAVQLELVRIVAEAVDARNRLHDVYALATLGGDTLDVPEWLERPTLELDVGERRAVGTDGCNRFQGPIEVVGADVLAFGSLAGTREACPGDGELPRDFMAALTSTRRYRRVVGGIELLDGRGTVVAGFRRFD